MFLVSLITKNRIWNYDLWIQENHMAQLLSLPLALWSDCSPSPKRTQTTAVLSLPPFQVTQRHSGSRHSIYSQLKPKFQYTDVDKQARPSYKNVPEHIKTAVSLSLILVDDKHARQHEGSVRHCCVKTCWKKVALGQPLLTSVNLGRERSRWLTLIQTKESGHFSRSSSPRQHQPQTAVTEEASNLLSKGNLEANTF